MDSHAARTDEPPPSSQNALAPPIQRSLVLGRFWSAPIVEGLGVALSAVLVVVWATVAIRSVGIIRARG